MNQSSTARADDPYVAPRIVPALLVFHDVMPFQGLAGRQIPFGGKAELAEAAGIASDQMAM